MSVKISSLDLSPRMPNSTTSSAVDGWQLEWGDILIYNNLWRSWQSGWLRGLLHALDVPSLNFTKKTCIYTFVKHNDEAEPRR
jgi:hypothetical protein